MAIIIAALVTVISCKKNDSGTDPSPAATDTPVPAATSTETWLTPPPTPTATETSTTAVLIDDFNDADITNTYGGSWEAYSDSEIGGRTTQTPVPAISSGGPLPTPGTYYLESNDWPCIYTHLTHTPSVPGTYYGFIGVRTDLVSARDYSSLTGIRFWIRNYWNSDANSAFFNVSLISQSDFTNSRTTHYRADYDLTQNNIWTFIDIPFSAFTVGYDFASDDYPNHPQTLNQVLSEVREIGFDFEFRSTTFDFQEWCQQIKIDKVEIY